MAKKQLPPDAPLARRTILKGATLGVGAGLVSTLTAAYCGTRRAISSLRRQRWRAASVKRRMPKTGFFSSARRCTRGRRGAAIVELVDIAHAFFASACAKN